ncbi:MAG: hypothetical protein ACK5QD_10855 [Brevundimonas sp.]|uniref:hypothetical protein n=1 Tax=Brevundimonas sp. TaxID=1871086 RepID=UPI003919447C
MGAAKKRREAFLREHPWCCFCGGRVPATTEDHVPVRAAFAGKIGPEGFEFPACEACNRGTAGSEQVFALYVRLFDRTEENYDERHTEKLIRGVRNNYPDLMPDANLTATEKRRVLRNFGWERARGAFLDEVPMVGIPDLVAQHMAMNARKLLAALFYRHTGNALNEESGVVSGWSQQGLPGVDEAHNVLAGGMPQLVIGARVNTTIGDQFSYRWGRNDPESLFGYAAEFGSGLFIFAAAAPWDVVADRDGWSRYVAPRSPQ